MESEKLKSIKVGGARRISASALAEFMRACDHGNTNGSASEVSRA
jgi:hypothetical protein